MFKTIVSENINGIEYFKLKGNKPHKILIFMPGLGMYKENYISHLQNFINSYETIYCIDLPEQGSKYNWRIGNMVRIIKEFIQYIDNPKIKQIHLAGHSAGAIAMISFLVNYDTHIEDILIDQSIALLDDELDEFPLSLPEAQKVNKIILYSPVDSFDIVFPTKVSQKLKDKKRLFLKRLFNILVNYPMYLMSRITRNKKFIFSISTNKDILQYFNLKISNHVSFFEYVSKYKTLFELYERGNEKMNQKIDLILETKDIILIYGSNDWLLKPFGKRKNKIDYLLSMNGRVKVNKFLDLGHLLNHKNRLDFNMNSQMILNKDVIKSIKKN